eukprot:966730-Pyramimonas_sp.AAC.1
MHHHRRPQRAPLRLSAQGKFGGRGCRADSGATHQVHREGPTATFPGVAQAAGADEGEQGRDPADGGREQ